MTTFTPGPWKVHSEHGEIGNITNADGSIVVAQAQQVEPRSHEVRVANAYLIAAAPEMLAALIKAEVALLELEHMTGGGDDEISIESEILTVRAAIAKARGET